MPPRKLTNEILNAAILGMEAQKAKLDEQIAELRQMLSGGPAETTDTTETAPRKRRKFSPAALRRMREAQQKRWARVRGESEPAQTAATLVAPKPKRKLSAAAKSKLVANLRKARAAEAAKAKAAKKTAR